MNSYFKMMYHTRINNTHFNSVFKSILHEKTIIVCLSIN